MKNNSYSLTETKDFYDIFLSVLLLPLCMKCKCIGKSFFFYFYIKSKKIHIFFSCKWSCEHFFPKLAAFNKLNWIAASALVFHYVPFQLIISPKM